MNGKLPVGTSGPLDAAHVPTKTHHTCLRTRTVLNAAAYAVRATPLESLRYEASASAELDPLQRAKRLGMPRL
jgi:hypothetical protein